MSDPWKIDLPAGVVLKAVSGGLKVPPDGWHAGTFDRHGAKLIKAIVRLQRVTYKKAVPHVARKAMEVFQGQLKDVVAKVLKRAGKKDLDLSGVSADPNQVSIEISMASQEALWAQAIQEVFSETSGELVVDLIPPIHSVMGQAYNRVSVLMGQEASQAGNALIARQAQGIASKIVNINDTTREMFQQAIRGAIDDGLSVTETASRLEQVMTGFNRTRINTIARTELSRAFTKGSIAAFQESDTLTHVSVIGCESREEDRWGTPSYQQFMYRGESTCNIQDVPVDDADKLNFHPNHTGTMIPSRFDNADGSSSSQNL